MREGQSRRARAQRSVTSLLLVRTMAAAGPAVASGRWSTAPTTVTACCTDPLHLVTIERTCSIKAELEASTVPPRRTAPARVPHDTGDPALSKPGVPVRAIRDSDRRSHVVRATSRRRTTCSAIRASRCSTMTAAVTSLGERRGVAVHQRVLRAACPKQQHAVALNGTTGPHEAKRRRQA
jgi:hypothetical protein